MSRQAFERRPNNIAKPNTISTLPEMKRSAKPLSSRNLEAQKHRSHHVGSPPSSFKNPWPSASAIPISKLVATRFFRSTDKNNLPIPTDRSVLVPVRKPDWGVGNPDKLRATWLGHASFLVETSAQNGRERGIRILLDPVFSERTSPVQWFGPKRYNPTPCKIEELPEVDVIAISHNHYDHLDSWTVSEVWRIAKARVCTPLIACALGNSAFFMSLLPGISSSDIVELDWWSSVEIEVEGLGSCELVCTPAQHTSQRGIGDRDRSLWCSWTICEMGDSDVQKSLFFAGDTGYRNVKSAHPTDEEEQSMPSCPAFKEIGEIYGPFDLALLPIGLYTPRDVMSTVHCSPDDSICVHLDLKSKRSIGMHYGTVRGGLSQYYEDVLEPPKRWKEMCEKKGLRWGEEVGLCDIGETVLV